MAGKGSRPRRVDKKTWDENYDKIFTRRKTVNDWADHFGDRIKSWDGFREYNRDDLLTEDEYEKGIIHCSLYGSKRQIHLTNQEHQKIQALEKEIGLNLGGIASFLNSHPIKP